MKDGETTVATYRYDALGRRVEKDVEEGVFERYVYAGLETIATYGASNAWKQDFVFGQGIDQVLMLEQADVLDADEDENTSETTRSFYHRNALGSVMAITEMDEDVAVSYRYDPYGAVTITRGGQTQQTTPRAALDVHGEVLRRGDGALLYRIRCYDSGTGRFLQRDPLSVAAGPSPYHYCSASPVQHRDPRGLMPPEDNNGPDGNPIPGTTEGDPPLAENDSLVEEWLRGLVPNPTIPGRHRHVRRSGVGCL